MLSQLLIFINFIGILLLSLYPEQDISVRMETPSEVQAGEEFEVQLIIEKGDIQSFSRFTQELPYGLTAKRLSTANADFSFEDQRLRMIWLKLPADEKITVSYSIAINKRLFGIFDLKGEFAFIEENERRTIDVASPGIITILPDTTLADSLLVDIENAAEILGPGSAGDQGYDRLVVSRSEPEQVGTHRYRINLNVKKGDLQKFAKIEEYIPEGYRAVEDVSMDGIFSFSQGTVKILWMNLPESPEFNVSYIIIPDAGKNIGDMNITGAFSYISGNNTETVPIEKEKELLADTKTVRDPVIIDTPDTTAEKTTEVKTDTARKEPEKIITVRPEPELAAGSEDDMLQSEEGIYYRVQLAAGHHEINIDRYFSRLKVKDEVKMEFHEGWRKYTTGSFKIYKDARDYRVMIWDTTPIKDAFVSAYDNGRRITVQEALMVTNHRWYR